jgi:hypothetical protein
MGNIMMGYVKYRPKHNAHFTNVADQCDVMLSVIGAKVSSPNAQYPALPKTIMNNDMTVRVEMSRWEKVSGFLHEDFKLNTNPTPSIL